MLVLIRSELGSLDKLLGYKSLEEILKIIEEGSCLIEDGIKTKIDFSQARGVIRVYREYSEGGCQSCKSFQHQPIEDKDWFDYCAIHEPGPVEFIKGYGMGVFSNDKKAL